MSRSPYQAPNQPKLQGSPPRRRLTLLLAGLLLAGPLWAVQADQRPEALAPEERTKLAQEARALNERGVQLYGEGKYATAVRVVEQALKIRERLYPAARYPAGHPALAQSLNNLGALHKAMGGYGKALRYYERALAMQQKLFPAARYPAGHPELALSLNNLGVLFDAMGEYGQALSYYEQALAMYQKLYPPSRYPDGHPALAQSLNNLGALLDAMGEAGKGLAYAERALGMWQKLYPPARFPAGHPALAESLDNLGGLLHSLGEYRKALRYYERALGMRQKLYPSAHFPDGHPDLAGSLINLGFLLRDMGEYGKALPYLEQALAMYQRLYPADRYPQGHPHLADSLDNLGVLLHSMRAYSKALPYLEKALAMRLNLYPASSFSQGHPELAASLSNLGVLLQARGEYGKALPYLEKALAMYQRLYPAARYPQGHPHLAASLNNVGALLLDMGESAKALPFYERTLAMCQKLYPASRYPDGHPDLAASLNNLGFLLEARGEHGKALPYYERALAMYQQRFRAFADQAAEAEALALAESLPLTRDGLLTVTARLPGTGAAAYRHVWQTKAALTRVLRRRHLAALAQADSSQSKKRWQELADTRRHLARLLAAPVRDQAARDKEVRELTDRKEKLERQLAAALPALGRQQELDSRGPESLARRLPAHSVFVDLLRYTRFEHDLQPRGQKGERRTKHYGAFLLAPGEPVRRIELGPAAPIEKALRRWRGALARGQDSPAGPELARLLWRPLARHLPPQTRMLYLAPDEDLAALPWAALPVGPGEVLLERYTVAVVPHGPFLLEQLLHPAPAPKGPGRLLALGGVRYAKDYPDLPGTRVELERVRALAGQRPVVRLQGEGATAPRLLKELAQARYAHLATHGYFNEAAYAENLARQARLWKNWRFQLNHTTERVGQGARNPLAFTGLVLAPDKEGAILNGEELVELPLEGLYLAVLSACESGRGAHPQGEVYGLQRAFHLAGCRNVVVSLWPVPDVPTLALMEQFYQRLWDDKKPLPPAEALRQAQLAVLRHPELVYRRARQLKEELAKRGASAEELRGIQKVLARLPEGGKVEELKRSPPLWWAGFILSGDGR